MSESGYRAAIFISVRRAIELLRCSIEILRDHCAMVLHFRRASDSSIRLCAVVQIALIVLIRYRQFLEVGRHWIRMEIIACHHDCLRNGLVQSIEDLNLDEWDTTTFLTIVLSLAGSACPSTPDTNTPRLLLALLTA